MAACACLVFGCQSPETPVTPVNSQPAASTPATPTPSSTSSPVPLPSTAPSPSPSASPAPSNSTTTDVLLFNGTGVSTSDWQNTEKIVKSMGLAYQLVDSAALNAMTLEQISSFGVMIFPGGSGGSIAGGLDTATRLRLREAVRIYGVGYVGFCAGAWVAVGPEADTTKNASYGFAIAKGSVLSLFHPGGATPTAAMVNVTFADGSDRYLVWWGGPATPEWPHGVIARYDTGAPAISETWSGNGLVVIAGTHPEAPQGWRSTAGNDPDGLDYDIAIGMIRAALEKTPMPAF